jgi:hypothetical protein
MNTSKTFIWMAVLLILSGTLWAQTPQGRISGRVSDQTGAIVPGAKVTILNTENGVKRVLTTNGVGEYVAPNLSPGLYSIVVEAPSFKKLQRPPFRLEVATDVRQDFVLQPGAATEIVTVSGEQPLVDTVSDVLGGTLTNKAINELPLQGRDFQNLLELRPGVQRTPGGGFHSVTSNGNRLEDNNYIVDGTDDNDVYYGDTVLNGAGVQGTPASHLSLDAIQEFNTQENQSADYGFKPGVVVNIGLKSGTNDFHGTAYYFHRNSAFDARNYFNPAPQSASALLLHDFGASAGGPIIKDKWFIFGNYEGVRHKVGNPYLATSPVTESLATPDNPEGNPDISIPDALAYCADPENECTPNSVTQLFPKFLNNPGFTGSSVDPALINFDFNNVNREDNFIIKSDYHLSQKHVLSGRYIYSSSLQTEEDTSPLRPEWLSQADTRLHVVGVNWTWTPSSGWVNEARVGYNRNSQVLNPVDHNRSPESYGLNTGVTDPRLFGFPRVSISPFDYMGGNYNWPLSTTPNATLQFVDNASVTRGSHNLRFGAEFRHGGSDYFRSRYGRGRVDFSSLEDFIGGNVRRGRLLTGDTHRNITLTSFGGFVQDDWRIRRRLTLNLGLRYDVTLPIKESNNLLANFYPDRGIVQVGRGIDSPYPADWKDFSPRIGVAWDVFGTGKTVLRFGGAIIYEQPSIRSFVDRGGLNENPSGALIQGVQNNGNIEVFLRTVGGFTMDPAQPWFGSPAPGGGSCYYNSPDDYNACDLFGVAPHLKTPYVASWNFNLQEQLTKSTVLQVAYVGNRGISLYSHRDINQSAPALSADCYYNSPYDLTTCEQLTRPMVMNCPDPIGVGTSGPCQPYVGFGNYLENKANSIYHGLQATLTQRAYRGLNFLAGYTWAHALDVGTSNRGGYPQDSTNFNAERGNGDYDIRHRFTFSLTYEPPSFHAPLQFGQGWTITSIVNLQTGEPYTLYDSFNDISFTGEALDRWNFAGNPGDIHWSARTPLPYFPDGAGNPACLAQATTDALLANLEYYGCFQQGSAVVTPPADGTFGNMRRNIFRGPAFHNWDMSVTKRFKLSERINLQLRGEFFNILNHTNFDILTLPTDLSDATAGSNDVGLALATPDVGASNPVVGSGGSRHIQLGVKLIW